MKARKLTRRDFLHASALAAASTVIAACSAPTAAPVSPTAAVSQLRPLSPQLNNRPLRQKCQPVNTMKPPCWRESQSWHAAPFDERLPANPLVLEPVSQLVCTAER